MSSETIGMSDVKAQKRTENRKKMPTVYLPAFLILLFLGFAPWIRNLTPLSHFDETRLIQIIFLMMLGVIFVLTSLFGIGPNAIMASLPKWVKGALGLFLALGVISSALAVRPLMAFVEVGLWILLFLAAITVANAIYNEREKVEIWLIIVLFFSVFVLAINFLAAYIYAAVHDYALTRARLMYGFGHIRFFSQFQSWVLPLLVLPILMAERRPWKLIRVPAFLLLAISWMMLFTSGTRGTMVSLAVAFIAVALCFRKNAKPWIIWQANALVAGLVGYLVLFFALPPLIGLDVSEIISETVNRDLTTSSGRAYMWTVALKHVLANPLLGVGPMHYACGSGPGLLAHPHNTLLQVACEWGIPATIIFVGLLTYAVVGWKRLKFSKENLPIKIVLTASIVTAGTHGLFSGVILMPLSQMTMVLVAGWSFSYCLPLYPAKAKKTALRYAFPVLVALACLIMIYPISQAPKQPDAIKSWHEEHPEQKTHKPRLWAQGKFCQ